MNNEQKAEWIKTLKEGDEVFLKVIGYGRPSWFNAKVVRFTKRFVIVKNNYDREEKFHISDGSEFVSPDSRRYRSTYSSIYPRTEANEAAARHSRLSTALRDSSKDFCDLFTTENVGKLKVETIDEFLKNITNMKNIFKKELTEIKESDTLQEQ